MASGKHAGHPISYGNKGRWKMINGSSAIGSENWRYGNDLIHLIQLRGDDEFKKCNCSVFLIFENNPKKIHETESTTNSTSLKFSNISQMY